MGYLTGIFDWAYLAASRGHAARPPPTPPHWCTADPAAGGGRHGTRPWRRERPTLFCGWIASRPGLGGT